MRAWGMHDKYQSKHKHDRKSCCKEIAMTSLLRSACWGGVPLGLIGGAAGRLLDTLLWIGSCGNLSSKGGEEVETGCCTAPFTNLVEGSVSCAATTACLPLCGTVSLFQVTASKLSCKNRMKPNNLLQPGQLSYGLEDISSVRSNLQ